MIFLSNEIEQYQMTAKRNPQFLLPALAECNRENVKVDINITGANHIKLLLQYNNKCKSVFTAGTPSDERAPMEILKYVKRAIRELKG